jgi:hypothetical protein
MISGTHLAHQARLQGSVARNHNRRHRYLGRFWQSRYRARVIDTNEYFRRVVAYVHLNPVAAGVVDDPAEYPYSGHREIVGVCRPHIVIQKHRNSVAKLLNKGLRREGTDPEFKRRLDDLDAAISSRG